MKTMNDKERIQQLEGFLSDFVEYLLGSDFDDIDFGKGFEESGFLERAKKLLKENMSSGRDKT